MRSRRGSQAVDRAQRGGESGENATASGSRKRRALDGRRGATPQDTEQDDDNGVVVIDDSGDSREEIVIDDDASDDDADENGDSIKELVKSRHVIIVTTSFLMRKLVVNVY